MAYIFYAVCLCQQNEQNMNTIQVHSTHIVKRTRRGESTSEELRSVGKAKNKSKAIVRTSVKVDILYSVYSSRIGVIDPLIMRGKLERERAIEVGQQLRKERKIERAMKKAARMAAKR